MGLDMYAMTTTERPVSAVDFKPEEMCELHYWRKHPNLHGWMEALYYEKGGKEDCFNCTTVILSAEDLDRLEAVIKDGSLPETSGFFFGLTQGNEREDDLVFIAKAREAIEKGLTVFYDSWW